MKTYSKFILNIFLRSFIYVFLVMFSLVLILNILTELEFFRNINVEFYFQFRISILTVKFTPNSKFGKYKIEIQNSKFKIQIGPILAVQIQYSN